MRKIKLIMLYIFAMMAIMIVNSGEVEAASASISPSSKTITQGETVTITASVTAGAWNLSISGAGKSESLVGQTNTTGNASDSKSISFTGTEAGTYTFYLTGDITDFSEDTAQTVNQSTTITVNAKTNNDSGNSTNNSETNTSKQTQTPATTEEKKSNDATLANLEIQPNDFSGFRPWIYSYSHKVPNNVETITIVATKPKGSKATVTGTGKQTLKEGENEFTIKVVAEDGKASKTYTINVTREKKTEDENTTDNNTVNENTTSNENQVSDTDETSTTGLTSLEVVGQTIKFDPNVYEYRINVDGNTEKLDIKTKTSSTNIGTEVVGNDELKVGENVITILVTNEETGSTATYQIIATKSDVAASQDLQDINEEMDATTAKQKNKMYILIAVIGIIVIALIVFFITKAKNKGKSEEIEKIDLSNDEKFFNKISNQKEEEIEEVEIPDENTEIPEEMSYQEKTIRRKANFATKDTFKPIDETERIQEYEKERANLDKRDGYAQENVEDDETGVYGRKDIEQLLKERRKGGKHF